MVRWGRHATVFPDEAHRHWEHLLQEVELTCFSRVCIRRFKNPLRLLTDLTLVELASFWFLGYMNVLLAMEVNNRIARRNLAEMEREIEQRKKAASGAQEGEDKKDK